MQYTNSDSIAEEMSYLLVRVVFNCGLLRNSIFLTISLLKMKVETSRTT